MLKNIKNNINENINENNFNNENNNNNNYNENNLENNRYYNNNNNQINNQINNNNNQINNNKNQINNNNNQINNNFPNEINTNFPNDIKKNSISPINQSPSQTNYINTDNFTTKNNNNNNQIENSFQKQLSNLNIDKINFGIETKEKENLSYEEQKLFNEAEKNLNKFFPPEKKDIKQIAKKLSKISFKNFIPTEKLNKISLNDENLIIFHGELNKMINYETNAHKPQMYTSKFCVLYPKYFKYYKSKENFLRNLKPSCVINLNQITKVNMAKVRKTSTKIDHIILCNKMGIINKNNNENDIGNLIDVNKYLYLPENRESLLIFTSSEGEEVVFKWFMIIQYFIQKNKENNNNENNENFDNNNENFDNNNENFDNNNNNFDNNNFDDNNNNDDDVINNNNDDE